MKATSRKLQVPSQRWFGLLLAACSLLLLSCGFQLRGHTKAQLPPELQVLRVTVAGSQAAYDPLLLAMQNALRTQAGATVQDGGEVPLLTLSGERFDSQVLSVGSTGRVSEYLLKYELSFRLTDAAGQELAPLQTIRLQRDYRFDPLNVLAKEREEQELRRDLQRDGVQQILRRLARISFKPHAPSEGADGASLRRAPRLDPIGDPPR